MASSDLNGWGRYLLAYITQLFESRGSHENCVSYPVIFGQQVTGPLFLNERLLT